MGSSKMDSVPPRVHRSEEARAAFGDLLDRLIPFLDMGDPLADSVITALGQVKPEQRRAIIDAAVTGKDVGGVPPCEPLLELVAQARVVPPWVDFPRLERAGAVFRRAGLIGGATLGLRSLVYGYAAPAGNKPLAFSGRLTERADRRLAETGRFVTAVCARGGLVPHAFGWQLCIQVRLMHAQVRKLLLASSRWEKKLWSLPINQHDMMATVLLFSNVFIDGVRMLGLHVTRDEADDYQHLWRWAGALLGVDQNLLPATHQEATRFAEFVHLTQGPPDEDSRTLVRALLDGPRRRAAQAVAEQGAGHPVPRGSTRRRLGRQMRAAEAHVTAASAVCRYLVGDELADALELPGGHHVASALRSFMRLTEQARKRSSRLSLLAEQLGARYWELSIEQGLGGMPPEYVLPERLGG